MREEPYLIRRPLVRRGNQLLIGANDKKLAEALPFVGAGVARLRGSLHRWA